MMPVKGLAIQLTITYIATTVIIAVVMIPLLAQHEKNLIEQ